MAMSKDFRKHPQSFLHRKFDGSNSAQKHNIRTTQKHNKGTTMTAEERGKELKKIEDFLNVSTESARSLPETILTYLNSQKETIFLEQLEKRVKDADEVSAIINDLNNQLGGLKFGFIPLGDMCRGAYWLIQYLKK